MKKHTKIYMDYFGYDRGDFIPCEITGQRADDVQHIDARGMGGSESKNNIYNLIATTRHIHIQVGDKKQFKDWVISVHLSFMETQTPWVELYPNCEVLKSIVNGS